MGRYLTDLADVCRRAGWPVVEVEGWQYRARGSGGYGTGKPDHVVVHHTASGPGSDGWPDVNYMTYSHGDAPLCNLYLSRDGTVYVCAAGATNTNGTGDCAHLEPDTANSSSIGIEAGNDGVGEPWPDPQQSAYVALCRVLCDAYGIATDRIHGHAEWAPARKIDVAGPSRYAVGGATWDFDAFRADVAAAAPAPTPPPARMEYDDMLHVIAPGRGATLIGPGFRHYAHTPDEAVVFERAYGPPVELSDYDYDILADAVFVNDPPKSQGGPW